MTEHQNVAVVRRAMQAMNETDMFRAEQEMGFVDAFMADDIVWPEIGRAEPRHGKDELPRLDGGWATQPRRSPTTSTTSSPTMTMRSCWDGDCDAG